jgi:hypothetical protein
MRRITALGVALLLCAALAAPVAAITPVNVQADAGWVSTGMIVTGSQQVPVTMLGKVQTAKIPEFQIPGVFKSQNGPEGQLTQPTCGEAYDTWEAWLQELTGPCVLRSAHWGELIGRVGDGGTPFLIGATSVIGIPPGTGTGTLQLTIGELANTYGDNRGAFTIIFE